MSRAVDSRSPWGMTWRCSVWFVTLVVGLGITTDLLVYSIIIPVIPFQLEKLHYDKVSALVGYLLFAYSGGIVISTPIIAALSERYHDRKIPLILGQICLVGSQILFMQAPKYWVMVIARIIQGVASSVVWVVGLALLCDTVPERSIGRQLGIAMTGLSLGLLLGPPLGGILYKTFGFRGPFICGIIFVMLDFFGRLLIVERKDTLQYGWDPHVTSKDPESHNSSVTFTDDKQLVKVEGSAATLSGSTQDTVITSSGNLQSETVNTQVGVVAQTNAPDHQSITKPDPKQEHVPFAKVVIFLITSPRALVVVLNTIIYGMVFTSLEPALPLHLQRYWHFDAYKVGLVLIAAIIPTLLSSGLSGWWCDKKGPEWLMVSCLLLAVPFWIAMISNRHLVIFIVVFGVQTFFTAAVVSPLLAELASISRSRPGVGYAHVYGVFNLSYGIGAAVGPLIGGNLYARFKFGWTVICLICPALFIMCSILVVLFTGDVPIIQQCRGRFSRDDPSIPAQSSPAENPVS